MTIMNDKQVKYFGPHDTIPGIDYYVIILKNSHLKANARIRELEDENRCLKMRLGSWRKLAKIVDAYSKNGLGPVDAMKQVIKIVNGLEQEILAVTNRKGDKNE